MNNNIENNICNAIDIILSKRLSDLEFNKTISAKIIEQISDYEYKLEYQDAKIRAYTINGAKYAIGDRVFVIIQNNKMSNTKYILSSVGKNGGEGPTIVVDSELDSHSENPVQNKVITNKITTMDEATRQLSVRIEEVFQSVSNGKTLLAAAITEKGIDTQKTDTFAKMASNILEINTGGSKPLAGFLSYSIEEKYGVIGHFAGVGKDVE